MSGRVDKKPKRKRLDQAMVDRDLVADLDRARRLIMAGDVRVNSALCDVPGTLVDEQAEIAVRGAHYVSRGGVKLAHALDRSGAQVAGLVAIDIGASTGGFSDVLLQRGVARLFAVDVGYGDLAWKVRTDPRVTVLERTNIRNLRELPEGALADLAVIDASFISLEVVLPAALPLLTPTAQIIALVKPQFEAARDQVGEGGVVRDAGVHQQVLEETIGVAHRLGLSVAGLYASPITGPAGNVEFLLWLVRGEDLAGVDVDVVVENALREAQVVGLKS
jgi:23S rRNA (cytidine1920-2'-O)/16S rRNA (cytidine1409-2'-O)-methyltransferase